MKVAVMFSGGKDSALAAKWAMDGHELVRLVSVKPRNNEAYLYHYPAVEHTPLQADAMGAEHTLLKCDVTGPEEEGEILRPVFSELAQGCEAVVLGGVGLQETQIRVVGEIARELGMRTLVPHSDMSSEELVKKQLAAGMDIIISDVAAGGLGRGWIGRRLDAGSFGELEQLAREYGFDPSGEGGAYNTFVQDAPWFSARVELVKKRTEWDPSTRSGWLKAGAKVQKKAEA